MTFERPISGDRLEPLVRAALEADVRELDVAQLLAQVEARLAAQGVAVAPAEAVPGARYSRRRILQWSAAASAGLVVGAGVGGYLLLTPTPASAYSLVQSARLALPEGADRCYAIKIHAPKWWPILNEVENTRVWTRGDRYRVLMELNGQELVWGQDEQRRTWVVYSPTQGLLFESNEVPPELSAVFSFLSLDVRSLAGQILEDCDLEFAPRNGDARDGLATVSATVKPGKGAVTVKKGTTVIQFHTAQLRIELKSKAIHYLELTRRVDNVEAGRFQFTLNDDQPQPDESYHLESHLQPNAEIYDGTRRRERMQLIVRLARKPKTR